MSAAWRFTDCHFFVKPNPLPFHRWQWIAAGGFFFYPNLFKLFNIFNSFIFIMKKLLTFLLTALLAFGVGWAASVATYTVTGVSSNVVSGTLSGAPSGVTVVELR